jgi:hypothetical protein
MGCAGPSLSRRSAGDEGEGERARGEKGGGGRGCQGMRWRERGCREGWGSDNTAKNEEQWRLLTREEDLSRAQKKTVD